MYEKNSISLNKKKERNKKRKPWHLSRYSMNFKTWTPVKTCEEEWSLLRSIVSLVSASLRRRSTVFPLNLSFSIFSPLFLSFSLLISGDDRAFSLQRWSVNEFFPNCPSHGVIIRWPPAPVVDRTNERTNNFSNQKGSSSGVEISPVYCVSPRARMYERVRHPRHHDVPCRKVNTSLVRQTKNKEKKCD